MYGRVNSFDKTVSYPRPEMNPAISKIVCAAVVNKRFASLLLSDPLQAVRVGYCGEKFNLAEDEMRRIGSIRASDLTDFCLQLLRPPEPAKVSIPVSTCD